MLVQWCDCDKVTHHFKVNLLNNALASTYKGKSTLFSLWASKESDLLSHHWKHKNTWTFTASVGNACHFPKEFLRYVLKLSSHSAIYLSLTLWTPFSWTWSPRLSNSDIILHSEAQTSRRRNSELNTCLSRINLKMQPEMCYLTEVSSVDFIKDRCSVV